MSTSLRDIRPPVEIMVWWPWILGALLLALIGLLAARLLRRSRTRAAAAAAPEPTPLERARTELAQARSELDTAADGHFSRLVSDALRRYIEAATGIRAREQTSEEFLESASRERLIEPESAGSLRGFLELCDLAKFARQPLQRSQRETLLNHASEFIERHHSATTTVAQPIAEG